MTNPDVHYLYHEGEMVNGYL